jgi:hypothetical protein
MRTSLPSFPPAGLRPLAGLLFTAGLLAGAAPARAAVSFDAASRAASTTTGRTSLAWSHVVGGGADRVLVVGVAVEDATTADATVTAVTYNGVGLTAVPGSRVSGGGSGIIQTQLFYLLNAGLPAAGTYTVNVTFQGPVDGISAGAVSLAGVRQGAPEQVAIKVDTSGADSISTGITVATAGAWVVDVVGSGNSGSFTASSGQTERNDLAASGMTGAGSTKAVAAAGSTTLGWAHSGANRLAHSLASFAPSTGGTTTFSLTTSVSGSGTVARSPNAASYAAGTVVTLTATPAAGQQFVGWSGSLSGTANPAAVTMDANKTVTATFAPVTGSFTLATSVNGSGSVSRSPNASSYAAGTVVTLTATPGAGQQFTGWSGDLGGTANPASLTMNANKSVAASFAPVQTGSALYVAPGGTDGAPGTIEQPTTLASAITRLAPGGTIFMRGGTYRPSATITIARGNNGTASQPKRVFAFGTERPVLDFAAQSFSSSNRGLQLNGHFWHLRGLEVMNAGDNGIYVGGNNNVIELCVTHHNRDTGLQLGRHSSSAPVGEWPADNLILNCTSYDNYDPDNGEDADGFAAKLTTGPGNVFRGCIAHHNIDDGWDLFTKDDTGPIGTVTIEDSVAYGNGHLSTGGTTTDSDGNGFKLGGEDIAVNHVVRRSIAFGNKKHGFTYNSNPGSITMANNTSWDNGESNIKFDVGTHVFTNNLSFESGQSDKTAGTDVGGTNCWWKNGVSVNARGLLVSAADFVSLAPNIFRNADGSINLGSFLLPAAGSDLVDAGTPAGTDIGARQR